MNKCKFCSDTALVYHYYLCDSKNVKNVVSGRKEKNMSKLIWQLYNDN